MAAASAAPPPLRASSSSSPPPPPPPALAPLPLRRCAFIGGALLVSVGYVDPGNWATAIGAGSKFGFAHLCVVAGASLVAIFLQTMCATLGVVTGRDLARACRDRYPRPVVLGLWVSAEIAIAATDLAEVIGGAVAFKLLFGIPVVAGVWITALDVLLLLALAGRRTSLVELLVGGFVLIILACFIAELAFVKAPPADVLAGFVPSALLVTDSEALLLAIGIVGATVMPHNLYLGSSLVIKGAGLRSATEREDDAAAASVAAAASSAAEDAVPASKAAGTAAGATGAGAPAGPPAGPGATGQLGVAAPAAAGGDVRVNVVDCAADGEAEAEEEEEEEENGGGVGAGRGAGGSTASDASARAAELGQLLPSPTAAGRQSPGAGTAAARLPSPLSSGASGGRRSSRTGGFALPSLPSLLLVAVPGGAGSALAGASGGAAADSTDAGAGAGAGAGAAAGAGLVICDLSGRSAAAVSAQLRSVAVETASLLLVALFVNCSILITSAAAFHSRGLNDVATLEEAHELLQRVVGDGHAAAVLFALALLASGQSSTITGTLAGQVVMEGFLELRVSPALRRFVTRMIAVVPAAAAAAFAGDAGLNQLLIASQVTLSFQLPFAIIPLLQAVSDERIMGQFALRGCRRVAGWACAALICALNAVLLAYQFG